MPDPVQHPPGGRSGPVRVVRLEQDPHSVPLGERCGGGQPAYRVRIGDGRRLLGSAEEHPDVGGFEVGGEPDQAVQFGEDRVVRSGAATRV